MSPHHARLPLWGDRTEVEKIDKLYDLVLDLYGYVMQDAVDHMLSILATHVPQDESERQSVNLMQRLISTYPNILTQNCEVGHVTGSALIVDPEGQKALLMHHMKLERWLQMGGHGDFEFSPALIALREAREESGLTDLEFLPRQNPPQPVDIDAHVIPASKGKPEHYHLDFRYVLTTSSPDAIQRRVDEANELGWFSFAEMDGMGLTLPTMRLVRKAQRLLALP